MYIQNASNIAQFQQTTRFAAQGEHDAFASNTKSMASAQVELTNIAAMHVVEQQPSASQLRNAVDGINKFMQQSNRNIRFSVDADTQKTVVKLVDSDTGDLIRQYPSKEVLEISKSIENMQQGMLLKQQA